MWAVREMFGMFGKLSAVRSPRSTMAAKATTTTPKTLALRTLVRRQEAAQRQKAAHILAAGQRRVERKKGQSAEDDTSL